MKINHEANLFEEDEIEYSHSVYDWFSSQASWMISMAFHALILVALSFVMLEQLSDENEPVVLAADPVEELELDEPDPPITTVMKQDIKTPLIVAKIEAINGTRSEIA